MNEIQFGFPINSPYPSHMHPRKITSQMNIYAFSQSTTIDDLPSDIILNIFERLPDSADLANCRLTSHRFLSLSYRTSSISLKPHQKHHPVPFKTRVINLISLLAASLVSISISGKGWGVVDTNEVDDLTDIGFLSVWLPLVGRQLGTLSIVNAPNKSPIGFSCALAVVSDTCQFSSFTHLSVLDVHKQFVHHP